MNTYGFTLKDERKMSEVGGIARLWLHPSTGAQLLSVINSDENKCFGVNFYTPPVNSTGVAHILEHSVLCGSSKYRVKEPFVELLKGSLQTFLNAFTFPDKTCYPVASANLQDFYNLVDVYLDAVFHPLLSRNTFQQEGWHIEAESLDGPWTFKGVVYNEMKGVYSSPDSVIAEKSQHAMFPDNLYSLDSGGNPQDIPNLTYEEFCDFHHRYYQPGNARFFFWGDDPEEKRLEIIGNAIMGYGPVSDLPVVELQKDFVKPVQNDFTYASSPEENRSFFTQNWLLPERGNISESLKLEMLEHILEGLPGSPLRRALTESGLGEDTIGCGLETDLRQMYYSTGLKGIQPGKIGEARMLIQTTLQKLVQDGIEPDAVAAAINTVEFAYRENNTGRFPRGLAAMILSLSTWLYGGDPLEPLAWSKPLHEIKTAVKNGEKLFENLIRIYFIDNKNSALVSLFPDPKLASVLNDEEAGRLSAMKAEASEEQRAAIVKEAINLREQQLKPDDPEALASLPALKIGDLPRKEPEIPCEVATIPQTVLIHELPTNGIAYIDCLLPVTRIPVDLLPYLPLFCRSLTDWGTEKKDYIQLGAQIAGTLGGMNISMLAGTKIATRSPFGYIKLSAKAVYEKLDDMFAIFEEVLLKPQKKMDVIIPRLGQMIFEDKARLEYMLQAGGHMASITRIKARYAGAAAVNEKLMGISQLRFLQNLAEGFKKEPEKLAANIQALGELLISSKDAVFNCTLEKQALDTALKNIRGFTTALPVRESSGEELASIGGNMDLPAAEAFITQGQVNYVGKGASLYDLGYEYEGSVNVISRWLRMGKLWEEVRVAGGAYGVFCSFDRADGTFVCASFRDPGVDSTLSAYDGLGNYLIDFTPTQAQLDQAIIGAIGDRDAYLLPDGKGMQSLTRWLMGLTGEMRQRTREQIFATTAKEFNNFGEVLEDFARGGSICVIGGSKAEAAAREHNWTQAPLI